MKQFTLKLACLLGLLLSWGGDSWAQTLTKVTSLSQISSTSKYVLKYNGKAYNGDSFYKNYSTACYFYYNGSAMSASTSAPNGDNAYSFTLEADVEKNTLKIKSIAANKYLTTAGTVGLADSGNNTVWNVEIKDGKFFLYYLSGEYWRFMVGYYATSGKLIQTQSAGKGGANKTDYMNCIEIYEVQETPKASFFYYDENKNHLNTVAFEANLSSTASENTLSNLTKQYPKYISATYYSDDTFTEEKKVSDSYVVTGNETFHVITSYNNYFLYPHNSETYFALASGNIYLGKENNGSTINHDNCSNFALLLEGDWYNNYQILNKEKLPLDGSNEYKITWTEGSTYRWEIDDDGYIKSATSGKYLQIGANNNLFNQNASSKDASTEAAATILNDMTAEYVGQYDKSQKGSVTFDDLVKGNNAIDFTNGTYYFVEKATNESALLSSNVRTTYGNTPSVGGITMSTAKNFSGLWKYEGGKFVHANSGLKLTSTGLTGTGATWSKTATGTDCVYTLNDGKDNLKIGEDSNWKFRLAKSVTLNLTEKNGKSYATTCAPVPVTLSASDADNTTLYIEKSHTESSLSVVKAETVAANTGIYIENTNADASVTLLFTENGETSTADSPILEGTNVEMTLNDRTLFRTLGFNNSGQIGFFKPASTIPAIPANRAYLRLSNISQTNAFYIDFDGTTTSIDELLPATEAQDNAPIYDLSGRRMQGTLHKGIYIQNGRKFMVK